MIGVLVAFAVIVPFASGLLRGQKPAGAPDSANTLFESGLASLKAGKYKQAEEAFRIVSELEPANSRGITGLVRVYTQQKRYDEAIQLLQAEVKKDPARLEYHLTIGNVAVQAAKYDLALEQFLGVLNRTDKFSRGAGDLYFRIGEVYFRKGELDFAIIFLRQAKELLPGNTGILTMLGLGLQTAGQQDAAEREYRAALDADPNNAGALNNLAFLLSERERDLDVALKYAQRAGQLRPDSPAVSDTLGWVYLKNNMTDNAVGILRSVVQKDPSRSSYHYHLAVALERKGDHAAAIEELTTALKSNPPKDEEQKIKGLLQKIGK
jgi:tetratricopeptide (TPR) repeat protein